MSSQRRVNRLAWLEASSCPVSAENAPATTFPSRSFASLRFLGFFDAPVWSHAGVHVWERVESQRSEVRKRFGSPQVSENESEHSGSCKCLPRFLLKPSDPTCLQSLSDLLLVLCVLSSTIQPLSTHSNTVFQKKMPWTWSSNSYLVNIQSFTSCSLTDSYRGQFRVSSQPNVHVFRLWEEPKAPGENPHIHLTCRLHGRKPPIPEPKPCCYDTSNLCKD